MAGDLDGDGATDLILMPPPPSSLFSVYLSTAKHPAPANPDIQCGTVMPSECTGPTTF